MSMRRLWETNPWLARNSCCLSILRPTAELVADLNAFRPSIVATYPTAAMMLAEQARAGRLRINPLEVWTGGEHLSAPMRRMIGQGLGAEVCNSYGASEFLPLAWECGHQRLHVNTDWVVLEAVDASHRPVAPGTVSYTTLLTNLANHVQPVIRFDIGDRVMYDAT
ncbi:MAG: phenylacetate--CoA ligase family protein, partial [Burkholderiaceae bacterium]